MDSEFLFGVLTSQLGDDLGSVWDVNDEPNFAASITGTPWSTPLESGERLLGPISLPSLPSQGPPQVDVAPSPGPVPIEQEVLRLRIENAELRRKNVKLETQLKTFRDDIKTILDRDDPAVTPITPSNIVDLAPLKQSDYPKVRFWYKHDWKNSVPARGKGRSSQGINVMMLYVETQDGQSVDGDRASVMRQTARVFWESVDKGKATAKWGQADMQLKQDYRVMMAREYPELRLCHLGWKAEQIAADGYSWWTKSKRWTDGDQLEPELGKRSRKDSAKAVSKRMKSNAFIEPGFASSSLDSEVPGVAFSDATTSGSRLPVGIVTLDSQSGSIIPPSLSFEDALPFPMVSWDLAQPGVGNCTFPGSFLDRLDSIPTAMVPEYSVLPSMIASGSSSGTYPEASSIHPGPSVDTALLDPPAVPREFKSNDQKMF